MSLPLGLGDISPRHLILFGLLSGTISALTFVPDPEYMLKILSTGAALGSFLLAYINSQGEENTKTQEAAASGGGPSTAISIGEMNYRVQLPDGENRDSDE